KSRRFGPRSARLRERRRAPGSASPARRLAEYDDIYDEVTAGHYNAIVKGRLQEEDFVVDDDVRGYAENGLEEWDDVREDEYSTGSEAEVEKKAEVGSSAKAVFPLLDVAVDSTATAPELVDVANDLVNNLGAEDSEPFNANADDDVFAPMQDARAVPPAEVAGKAGPNELVGLKLEPEAVNWPSNTFLPEEVKTVSPQSEDTAVPAGGKLADSVFEEDGSLRMYWIDVTGTGRAHSNVHRPFAAERLTAAAELCDRSSTARRKATSVVALSCRMSSVTSSHCPGSIKLTVRSVEETSS
ncbi:MAG: DNA polymerase alpha subunit p180 N terminal-domain-containing protein, partial [Olpidium bornovanus]